MNSSEHHPQVFMIRQCTNKAMQKTKTLADFKCFFYACRVLMEWSLLCLHLSAKVLMGQKRK